MGLGFLHGGASFAGREEEIRYIRRLANDNVLPRAFADQLLAAPRPLPHILEATGPWLSSDRPPMETCLYLLVRAVLPGGDPQGLIYQDLGTFLQSLWMPALWCLFHVVGLPRRVIAAGLATLMLSGFIIFNSFYVWPKLFPAAFLVLLVAMLLTEEWDLARSRATGGFACGIAAGVALLGHEGSALALAPLAIVALAARKRWPRPGCAVAAAASLFALMLPWILYQRYYDPPGDDLSKLQLAGTSDFNPKQGLVTTIVHAYDRLNIAQIASYKWSNLAFPFVHEPAELKSLGSLAANLFAAGGPAAASRLTAVEQMRNLSYLYFLPALGLLAIGPLAHAMAAWLRRQQGADLVLARRIWTLLAVSVVFWALALFGPRATGIYQGSYEIELLAFAAATIGLWRLSHRLTAVVLVGQAAIGVVVYATVNPRLPYMIPPPLPIQSGEALLCAIGLVVAILLPLLAPASARPNCGGHMERAP